MEFGALADDPRLRALSSTNALLGTRPGRRPIDVAFSYDPGFTAPGGYEPAQYPGQTALTSHYFTLEIRLDKARY
jgi:hypothetical protein